MSDFPFLVEPQSGGYFALGIGPASEGIISDALDLDQLLRQLIHKVDDKLGEAAPDVITLTLKFKLVMR